MTPINLSGLKNTDAPSPERKGGLAELLSRDISLFGNGLGDKKKERFYSELSILLTAGIDIKTALEIIVEQQTKKKDREIFDTLLSTIVRGDSFSAAISKSGKFSLYEYYSLGIGEESGRLPEVIRELTRYYANKIRQKRQIVSSLTYPAIVITVAFAAIYFMMRVIVPMFADIFKRFSTELPYLTRLVISASELIAGYFPLILLLISALVAWLYSRRKTVWFRKYSSSLLLRTPVAGNMIRKVYMARFSQAMSLLLSSRTPLTTSLELVKNMIGFYPVEHSLAAVHERIIRGSSLFESLREYPIYDKRLVSLIKVGEEVNKLDVIFEKLHAQYEEEIENMASVLGTLLEPVLIVFLGLLVAVILVAMYLPLFKLSTSVGI
jgi:type IV pilus assembly protein PilC